MGGKENLLVAPVEAGGGAQQSPWQYSRVVGEPWQGRGRVSQALRTGRDEAVMIHAWGFALVGILGRR